KKGPPGPGRSIARRSAAWTSAGQCSPSRAPPPRAPRALPRPPARAGDLSPRAPAPLRAVEALVLRVAMGGGYITETEKGGAGLPSPLQCPPMSRRSCLSLAGLAGVVLLGAAFAGRGAAVRPAAALEPQGGTMRAPELEAEAWINAPNPIRLADLKGKVVLLDFWTYG